MQIGFNAPTSGALIGPESLTRIITEGEALGFDYVTISDHTMVPRHLETAPLIKQTAPRREKGGSHPSGNRRWYGCREIPRIGARCRARSAAARTGERRRAD